MKRRLTKSVIDNLRPGPRQYLVWDENLTGFGALINPSGAKTFVAQREIKGRGRNARITIGRLGPFTVDEARIRAGKLLAQMADGLDPREEERQLRAKTLTLREALALALETAKAKGRAGRTITDYEKLMNRYMAGWMGREMADIGADRKGVASLHKAVTSKHGPVAGNQLMRVFRLIYNRAVRQHPDLPANPIIAVDFNPEPPKDRAIPEEIIPRWVNRAKGVLSPIKRDFYVLLLFSGLRNESARSIKWEDVHFEEKTLSVPRPKGGERRAFVLPLSDYMMELLKDRKEEAAKEAPGSPYAFPSLVSKVGYMVDPRFAPSEDEAWGKLDKEEGEPLPLYSPHCFRHTYITAANSAGVAPYDVKMLANHRLPGGDITARYISPQVEPLRRAQERVTDYLLNLIEPRHAQVVPIRRGRGRKAK